MPLEHQTAPDNVLDDSVYQGHTWSVMEADVIVVGAGPTGLMLGTELRMRGARTVIVEKLTERNPFGKAHSIQPRTAEVLELRDLLAAAKAKAEGSVQGSHFTVGYLHYGPLETRQNQS